MLLLFWDLGFFLSLVIYSSCCPWNVALGMLSFGIVLWFAAELQTRVVHNIGETVGVGFHNQSTNQHKPLLDPRRDQINVNTKAFSGEMFGDDRQKFSCAIASNHSLRFAFIFHRKRMATWFNSVFWKVAVSLLGIPDQNNNCRIILARLDDVSSLMLPLSFVWSLLWVLFLRWKKGKKYLFSSSSHL